MVPYLGLSVGLHCWWIWHSAEAIAQSAIVSESSCCWGHAYSPLLPPSTLCSYDHPLGKNMNGWEQRLTVHRESSIFDYWTHLQLKSFVEHLKWNTSIFICFTHLESSIHILLPKMPFSPIFQPCSFQVPDNPINPLAIMYQSVSSWTFSHFSFQTNYMTLPTAWTSVHCEDFPSPVSFMLVSEWGWNSAAVHFWVATEWCTGPSVNLAPLFSSVGNQS